MKRIVSLLLTAVMTASLCCVVASAANFRDVPNNYWASKEIAWANSRGLMNGTTSTTFNPTGNTLRGQMTAILYRYAGSPAVSGRIPYSDVTAANYYADASIWAKQHQILAAERLTETKLNPGTAISRAEFCTMVYNYAKAAGKDMTVSGTTAFTDLGGVTSEAKTAITWANKRGVVNGTSSTTFNPSGTLTRAAAAAMLYRYEHMSADTTPTTPATGDNVTLTRGANLNVSLKVGQMLPLIDSLGEAWTCKQAVDGDKIAAITYDFGQQRQVVLGLSAGTTTMTILSSRDYATVLATVQVTVSGSEVSGGSGSGAGAFDAGRVDLSANLEVRNEIVRLTNEVRRENGVSELSTDSAMMNAAQAAAEYYAETLYAEKNKTHNSEMESEILKSYGIADGAAANLAGFKMSDVANHAVNSWVNSKGHFNAMTNSRRSVIGVGVTQDAKGYYWCVQFFA